MPAGRQHFSGTDGSHLLLWISETLDLTVCSLPKMTSYSGFKTVPVLSWQFFLDGKMGYPLKLVTSSTLSARYYRAGPAANTSATKMPRPSLRGHNTCRNTKFPSLVPLHRCEKAMPAYARTCTNRPKQHYHIDRRSVQLLFSGTLTCASLTSSCSWENICAQRYIHTKVNCSYLTGAFCTRAGPNPNFCKLARILFRYYRHVHSRGCSYAMKRINTILIWKLILCSTPILGEKAHLWTCTDSIHVHRWVFSPP